MLSGQGKEEAKKGGDALRHFRPTLFLGSSRAACCVKRDAAAERPQAYCCWAPPVHWKVLLTVQPMQSPFWVLVLQVWLGLLLGTAPL